MYFSAKLEKRCKRLSEILDLTESVKTMIRFEGKKIGDILLLEAERSDFAAEVVSETRADGNFRAAWGYAAENLSELTDEERGIVLSIGRALGGSDISSQLSMLETNGSLLQSRLEEARSERLTKGKMYRTAGVAVGLGLAVMLV